jgi:electron transfer flavoprotein alpha subunit
MSTIAAFIDFKSGNLTSRSIQIINLVNSIAKNFSELEKVCFYTLDSVDAVGINTSIPSTLIQIKGLQEDRTISNSQLSEIVNSIASNNCTCVIGYKSAFIDHVLASMAVHVGLPVITQINSISIKDKSIHLRQSIFSGKANSFLQTNLSAMFILNPAFEFIAGDEGTSKASNSELQISASLPYSTIVSMQQGHGASLVDAAYVVGAGRGLKDPSNWTMIEELATKIGAATACSKPVSDVNWRPHSEHVGQTGIKIAPKLYIACGISGAIQHLAGVNGSKTIVVINNDPEAPFFKYADYGIVGDVFEIVPEIVKNL